jgi:hypothetical protein
MDTDTYSTDQDGQADEAARPETDVSADAPAPAEEPVEFEAPNRAALAMHEFTADTGIDPIAKPTKNSSPPMVSDLADYDDGEIGRLYAELVEWTSHIHWRIEYMSNEVMFAERQAGRAFVDAKTRSPESSDAGKERDAKASTDVRRAEDKLDEKRARLRYWRAVEKQVAATITLINREVSMRIARMPAEARGAGMGT